MNDVLISPLKGVDDQLSIITIFKKLYIAPGKFLYPFGRCHGSSHVNHGSGEVLPLFIDLLKANFDRYRSN